MIVALDIGGTKTLIALISQDNKIVDETSASTPHGNANELYDLITESFQEILKNNKLNSEDLKGVGVSIAGTVNHYDGFLFCAPNIGLSDLDFANEYSDRINCSVYLDNDANLACLGEFLYGAGQGAKNLVLLTFGTGIGGGIIIDRQLFRGSCGSAGELGHSVIQIAGPECSCGRLGCYEEIASGRALGRLASEMTSELDRSKIDEILRGQSEITGEMIGEAAKQDKEFAIKVFQKYAIRVAEGVINYVNIFNPDKVILGGGVMDTGEDILEIVKTRVKEDALPPNNECVDIVQAKLGNKAGIFGAAGLVRLANNKNMEQ